MRFKKTCFNLSQQYCLLSFPQDVDLDQLYYVAQNDFSDQNPS